MGLFGKKEDAPKEEQETDDDSDSGSAKYMEQCSLCGKAPTEKKWAGQYFHKKCLRRVRKGAKGMF